MATQKQLIPSSRPRPIRHSDDMLRATARELAKSVHRWQNGSSNVTDKEMQEIENDLFYALDDHASDLDGYKLSRTLERDKYWDVDSELVDILGQADITLFALHRKAVIQWVKDNDIQPRLDVGALVPVRYRDKLCGGEIVRVDRQHAEYTVFIESEGHVREGQGTHGTIVAFETLDSQVKDCPDCSVAPGEFHRDGCDVARCAYCGCQQLSCGCADESVGKHAESLPWTGFWPGTVEALMFGFTCVWNKAGWQECPPVHSQAQADLNRLMGTCEWDPSARRWMKPQT